MGPSSNSHCIPLQVRLNGPMRPRINPPPHTHTLSTRTHTYYRKTTLRALPRLRRLAQASHLHLDPGVENCQNARGCFSGRDIQLQEVGINGNYSYLHWCRFLQSVGSAQWPLLSLKVGTLRKKQYHDVLESSDSKQRLDLRRGAARFFKVGRSW